MKKLLLSLSLTSTLFLASVANAGTLPVGKYFGNLSVNGSTTNLIAEINNDSDWLSLNDQQAGFAILTQNYDVDTNECFENAKVVDQYGRYPNATVSATNCHWDGTNLSGDLKFKNFGPTKTGSFTLTKQAY